MRKGETLMIFPHGTKDLIIQLTNIGDVIN
jgi:hypothetical protein